MSKRHRMRLMRQISHNLLKLLNLKRALRVCAGCA